MDITGQPQNYIDYIRVPVLKSLPRDIVIELHKTLVHLVKMRRSVEVADMHVQRSIQAVRDTQTLLARLRRDGF